ncbi:MAG TPA: hypothetical protein VHS03_08110 [Gaiellaceae bacterium]|nr:hypothetical protein [Gaiellaceae bacterium]
MRIAIALGALALGTSVPVTVLPRPSFPGPAAAPTGAHRLVVTSSRSTPVDTSESVAGSDDVFRGLGLQNEFDTANRIFAVYGKDGSTGRYLITYTKAGTTLYAFDFASYGLPPRIKPGEREFVYEQPVWAQESNGMLYVETTHATYASSSYGRNGYITAIDLSTKRAVWRSPALVANASTFLITKHYLVTGYGFTDEPDYLYLLDRTTGKVVDRLLLPNAAERITWQGAAIRVRTYDHVVVVRLRST